MTCTRCGAEKPLEEFPLDRRRPSGRQHPCRACQREAARRWKRQVNYRLLKRIARDVVRNGREMRARGAA